jgi:hypothetical protein
VVNLLRGFSSAEQRPPVMELNIMPFIPNNAGMVRFDLALPEFDVVRKLVRSGFLMLFFLGLALLTRKVIKW